MADYKVRMKAEQADEAEEIVDLVNNLTSHDDYGKRSGTFNAVF